jgi:hypothetical protein
MLSTAHERDKLVFPIWAVDVVGDGNEVDVLLAEQHLGVKIHFSVKFAL